MFFDPLAKVLKVWHQELMMQSRTAWEIWAKGQRISKDKESEAK